MSERGSSTERAVEWIAVAVGLWLCSSSLSRMLFRFLLARRDSADAYDPSSWRLFRSLVMGEAMIELLAWAALAIAAGLVWRAAPFRPARAWIFSAALGAALLTGSGVFNLYASVAELGGTLGRLTLLYLDWTWLVLPAAVGVTLAGTAMGLRLRAKILGRPVSNALVASAVLGALAMPLVALLLHLDARDGDATKLWWIVQLAIDLLAGGATVWLALSTCRAVEADDSPGRWERAASGLEIFATALQVLVGVSLGATLLLTSAVLGRSPGLAGLVALAVAAAIIACTVAMVVGTAQVAAAPAPRATRMAARVAGLLLAAAALLRAFVLLRTLELPDSKLAAAALRWNIEDLASLESSTSALALLAYLTVVVAIRRAGEELEDHAAVRKAGWIGAALAAVLGAQLTFSWSALRESWFETRPGVLLLAAGGIATVALAVALTRVARAVAARMRTGPVPGLAHAVARSKPGEP